LTEHFGIGIIYLFGRRLFPAKLDDDSCRRRKERPGIMRFSLADTDTMTMIYVQ
jgi:hypothetical protein